MAQIMLMLLLLFIWFVHCVSSFPTSSTPVHTLILCRHGDSIWNGGEPGTQETFTGWTDVPLSAKGVVEARQTGEQVSSYYTYGIDACFTSILVRAQMTAHYCMWGFSERPKIQQPKLYVTDYRLNERHYGSLQGYIKNDVEQGMYGHSPKAVKQWRRSWDAIPPLLNDDDPRRIEEIRKFQHHCGGKDNVPIGESLEMVANNRIRPFLNDVLHPILCNAASQKTSDGASGAGGGGTGLVVAHANSLRALIGVICRIEEDPIVKKKIEAMKLQTGVPLVLNYRRTPDGEYYPCDLSSSSSSTLEWKMINPSNGSQSPSPDLPVWPLSAIPFGNDVAVEAHHQQQLCMEPTNVVKEPVPIGA